MEVKIVEVDSDRKFGEFIRFPYDHYRLDDNFVPPLLYDQYQTLREDRNHFWQNAERKLFIAYDKKKRLPKPIGRIAAIIDHNYIKYHDDKTGYFGFFETEHHPDIANALLGHATEYLKANGMERVIGPLNPSINDVPGLLIDGFNRPPVIMMPYNPPYYAKLLEGYGFQKATDLYAFYIDNPEVPEKLEKLVPKLEKRGRFTIRPIRMDDLDNELVIIHRLYNEVLKDNYAFVPIELKELQAFAAGLKKIAEPDLILIAEVDGEPVGFSLALPDINQALIKMNGKLLPFGIFKFLYHRRKTNRIRVLIMGVLEKYRKRGIDLAFYYHTFKNGVAKGYYAAEISWIRESNDMMIKMADRVNAQKYKTYRIYQYHLEEIELPDLRFDDKE
ncbi:MAG: N-acetyltransferase family protein [Candidatus Zixiibacteriota bacterium]